MTDSKPLTFEEGRYGGAESDVNGLSARQATNPRKQLVRDQLIDIAAKLFDSKGYEQVGMGDIAKELGLGRSAAYHYFRSKEEILSVLVETEALEPSHQLQELTEDDSLTPTERLRRALVSGIVRRLASGSRFILYSRLEAQIPKDLSEKFNHSRRQIYDFYVKCITDGVAAGEFRNVDPKISAFAIIGMANWTSRWYSASGSKTPDEIAEIIADFALAGLRAPQGRAIDEAALRSTLERLRTQIDALDQQLATRRE